MGKEQYPKGHEEGIVGESVRQAYNYIFYGIDQDDRYWLFAFTNKAHVIKAYPKVAELFLEGAPTITSLGFSMHGDIPDPNHGGPLGYEIYLISWEPRRGKITRGSGLKYTIYHTGIGFVEEQNYQIKDRFLREEGGIERKLAEKDRQGLSAVIQLIQSIYKTANPWRYDISNHAARVNGIGYPTV